MNGGFTASEFAPCTTAAGCTYTFSFQAKNSHGALSAATNATVVFPAGSGLAVNVLDGHDKTTTITDYRWIIEEDRTFYINPNCTAESSAGGLPDRSGGNRPHLWDQFPHQLHAIHRAGLHRAFVLRRRPDRCRSNHRTS